jgi:hypothetical protein
MQAAGGHGVVGLDPASISIISSHDKQSETLNPLPVIRSSHHTPIHHLPNTNPASEANILGFPAWI